MPPFGEAFFLNFIRQQFQSDNQTPHSWTTLLLAYQPTITTARLRSRQVLRWYARDNESNGAFTVDSAIALTRTEHVSAVALEIRTASVCSRKRQRDPTKKESAVALEMMTSSMCFLRSITMTISWQRCRNHELDVIRRGHASNAYALQ